MNDKPPGRPYFWPALFLTAFVLAALLWAVWMYALVQKTRRQRQQNGFFVPQESPKAVNPPAPAPTNSGAQKNATTNEHE